MKYMPIMLDERSYGSLIIVAIVFSSLFVVAIGLQEVVAQGSTWTDTLVPSAYGEYRVFGEPYVADRNYGTTVGVFYSGSEYVEENTGPWMIETQTDFYERDRWRIAGEAALVVATDVATYAALPSLGTYAGIAPAAISAASITSYTITYNLNGVVYSQTVTPEGLEATANNIRGMGGKILTTVANSSVARGIISLGAGHLASGVTHLVFGEGWKLKDSATKSIGTYIENGLICATVPFSRKSVKVAYDNVNNIWYINGVPRNSLTITNYLDGSVVKFIGDVTGWDTRTDMWVIKPIKAYRTGQFADIHMWHDFQSGAILIQVPQLYWMLNPTNLTLYIYPKNLHYENFDLVENDYLEIWWAGDYDWSMESSVTQNVAAPHISMNSTPNKFVLLENVSVKDLKKCIDEGGYIPISLTNKYIEYSFDEGTKVENKLISLWELYKQSQSTNFTLLFSPGLGDNGMMRVKRVDNQPGKLDNIHIREWYAEIDAQMKMEVGELNKPMYALEVSPTLSYIAENHACWRMLQVRYKILKPANYKYMSLPTELGLYPVVFGPEGANLQAVIGTDVGDPYELYWGGQWVKSPFRYQQDGKYYGPLIKVGEFKETWDYDIVRVRFSGLTPFATGENQHVGIAFKFLSDYEIEKGYTEKNEPLWKIENIARGFALFKYTDKPVFKLICRVENETGGGLENAQITLTGLSENIGVKLTQEEIDTLKKIYGVTFAPDLYPEIYYNRILFWTGPTGEFWFYVPEGTYSMYICHPFYQEKVFTINIGGSKEFNEEEYVYVFTMEPLKYLENERLASYPVKVKGYVKDKYTLAGIQNFLMRATISGPCGYTATVYDVPTDNNGYFEMITSSQVAPYRLNLRLIGTKNGWYNVSKMMYYESPPVVDNYIVFDVGTLLTERAPSGLYPITFSPYVGKSVLKTYMVVVKTTPDYYTPFYARMYCENGVAKRIEWKSGDVVEAWWAEGVGGYWKHYDNFGNVVVENIGRNNLKQFINVDNYVVNVMAPYYDNEIRTYKMWIGEQWVENINLDDMLWIENYDAHRYWYYYGEKNLRRSSVFGGTGIEPTDIGVINLYKPVDVILRAVSESNQPVLGTVFSLRGLKSAHPDYFTTKFTTLYGGLGDLTVSASKEGYYTVNEKISDVRDVNYVTLTMVALPSEKKAVLPWKQLLILTMVCMVLFLMFAYWRVRTVMED